MKKIFSVLLLTVTFFGYAQRSLADDYDAVAMAVKTQVWGWDYPEFKSYNVPEKYKDESSVVLAVRKEIIANRRRHTRFSGNIIAPLAFHKEITYYDITRKMVKINDKSSLDNYSSLSFRDQRKGFGFFVSSKFQTIVGARVIKPDGKITEVDIKENAVTVDENGNNKKVAIPDLQVGDIIDYFVCDREQIDMQNPPVSNIVLCDDCPILSYSVHCDISNNLTTEYRSMNGAPEFTVSTDEDGDVILDAKKENIEKLNGLNMWVSPFRQLPMIRLAILDNNSKYISHPKSARSAGLHKDVPSSDIIQDEKYYWGGYWNISYSSVFRATINMVKEHVKTHPQLSKDSLAMYIFDALNYNSRIMGDLYFNRQVCLYHFFKRYKIDNKFAIITSRLYGPAKDELLSASDLFDFILANNDSLILTANNVFHYGGEEDPDYGCETATTFANYKIGKKMLQGTEGTYKVPVSAPDKNSEIVNMKVALAPDPTALDITYDLIAKGALKSEDGPTYYTMDKWQEEMRSRLELEGTFEDYMKETRGLKKQVGDYAGLVEEGKKDLADNIKKDISLYYDSDPKEVLGYEVRHLGVTPQHPDLEASTHYLQEGLVQRAGENLILNAGRLIGRQLDFKGDERKRDIDMYFPSTRMFQIEIQIAIPDGYTVDNLSNLNINADNETASFVSSASVSGNTITIKTCKTYKTIYQPVSNWNKLLSVLDAATKFSSQSIVLKKK